MLRNTSVLSAGFISLIKQVFIVKTKILIKGSEQRNEQFYEGIIESTDIILFINQSRIISSVCLDIHFDYYAGNLNLSIKCNRCKRVLTLKKIDEKYVAERMINGKLFV